MAEDCLAGNLVMRTTLVASPKTAGIEASWPRRSFVLRRMTDGRASRKRKRRACKTRVSTTI